MFSVCFYFVNSWRKVEVKDIGRLNCNSDSSSDIFTSLTTQPWLGRLELVIGNSIGVRDLGLCFRKCN